MLAADPQVSLDLDLFLPGDQLTATALIGEDTQFSVTFDNASSTADLGYGPFVDVVVNYGGVDGIPAFAFPPPAFSPVHTTEPDGLGVDVAGQSLNTLITATLYGAPVSLIFTPLFPGCANHPFAIDSSFAPLQVCGAPGEVFVTARLPFGSFAHDQPEAPVIFTARVSPLADVVGPGNELAIRARGGFEFGLTPEHDPATDPTIVGPTGNNVADQASGSWLTGLLTPSLMTVSKTFLAVENETATGEDFPKQVQIAINIAAGQTITNLQVRDLLPNNVVFVSLDSVTPTASPAPTLPGPTPSNNATLLVPFASVTGVAGIVPEVVVTFSLYVPENDANGNPILDPATGAPSASPNNVRVEGDWIPVDTRDQTNGFGLPIPVLFDPPGPEATLTDRSIAIQKFVSINGGAPIYAPAEMPVAVVPGDMIEYILEFQISDHFGFEDLIIDDFYSDGQTLKPTFTPTLSVTTDGTTVNTTFGAVNFTDDPFVGLPTTPHLSHHLQFRVSDEMVTSGIGLGGQLYGGFFAPFDLINGDGPTTGEIRFQTVVDDAYLFFQQGIDKSLNEHDELFNTVEIVGELLDLDGTGTGATQTDDSAAFLQVPVGRFSKSIYAINGVQVPPYPLNNPPPPHIAQGDTLTYRLRYDLTLGDFEDFKLRDFLPHPKFVADDGDADGSFNTAWARSPAINSLTIPAAGTWSTLPSDTHTPATLLSATASPATTGSNSIEWSFGTFPDAVNTGGVIDILFTVTATNIPFADGLFLTNQGVSSHQDTHLHPIVATEIVPIVSSEPNLRIIKGVVKTDNNLAGVFSPVLPSLPNPLFSAIGVAGFRYLGGNITSANLPTLISSNLSNIDAGDRVTFAIAVENIGSGPNGAFDVMLADTMPAGFHIPFTVPGLNLSVTDGTGVSFTTIGNLFGAGLELVDPGTTVTPSGALDNGQDNLGNQINNGRNILFITYDLEANFPSPVLPFQPVAACQQLTNTATLLNYADAEAAPNFIPGHLIDTATVTIACPTVKKNLVQTGIVNGNNNNTQAVIGETASYIITVTVPEGVSPNVLVVDTLPPGMAYDFGSVFALPAGVTITGSTVPTVGVNGSSATFNLGTVTNSNSNNNVPETLTFFVRAVVLDVFSNQNGTLLTNTANVSWDGNVLPAVSAPAVQVIEPVLQVDKSFLPASGNDAGDTVTFTITVSNVGPSTTDAYDTILTDAIPFGFNYVNGSLAYVSGVPVSPSESGGVITANWSSFPLNSSSTFTFQAVIDDLVAPCQSLPNTVNTTWTSLPGNPGQISTFNTDSTERTGSGVGPNDYFASDVAIVRVDCPTPTKSIVETSEASTLGNQVTIGEIVRYQLKVELPQGAYSGLTLQDILPSFLLWVDPGQVTVTVVSDSLFGVGTPVISPNVTFAFGPFVNTDVDPNAEFLIVEFNALVTNTPLNTAGDIKPNHFDVILPGTPAMPPTIILSNTVDVVIVEPHLVVDKQAVEVTGDHVTYTITITNTGTSTAFDTTFVDALYNGPAILPFDLSPGGDSLTITYTVLVRPCDDLSNEVIVTASSLPGTHGTFPNPTGTQTPGDPDDLDGERTYTVSDSVILVDVGGPCGPIIGDKWLDANGDGMRQETEVGLGGVTIFADQDGDGVLDANEAFAVTSFDDQNTANIDETGQYTLYLPAGSYEIREIVPAGYYGPTNVPGGFYTLNFAAPFPALTFDFGNTPNGVGNFFLGSIHGVKFDDVDNDGSRDPGEPGVPFVRVYLDANGDGSFQTIEPSMLTVTDDLSTATVDETGWYWFMNLGPGTHQVREDVPAFATQTSFPPPITIQSGDVWVGHSGQSIIGANQIERLEPTLEIGNHYEGYGNIHGCKFNDLNGNGIADDGETGLPGVTFELYMLGADNQFHLLTTTTTSSTAAFWFDHLLPGTYQLIEVPAPGAIITTPPLADIILLPGQTVSFGDCEMPGSVHGEKWEDLDGDGLHDPNEPGVVGVQVYADLNHNGQFDNGEPTALTMADDPATAGVNEAGHYWLDVPPGTLTIREALPAGFAQSFPMSNGGANVVIVGSGETLEGIDFGNYVPVEFHGIKFEDKNGNGVQDPGELGLAGWTITIIGTDGMGNPVNITTTTMADDPATEDDETGMYWVLGLKPGTYTVEEQQQVGWVVSTGGSGYTGTFPSGSGSVPPLGTPLDTDITLISIPSAFNKSIGIDYHEPTNSVVISVNYSNGLPRNFDRLDAAGNHLPFSTYSGLTDEVKIAAVRSGNVGGFTPGDLFTGSGIDGEIVRITNNGSTIINPWVSLPGNNNGLMRGSLYVDRTGAFGGDLIAVTTLGEFWRITSSGVATMLANVGTHLEGVVTIPNDPLRYGPLAGRILAGAEGQQRLYAVDASGAVQSFLVGVEIEDIDLIPFNENFYGVNYGSSSVLGAPASEFNSMVGDILLTQELHAGSGLFRLTWDGTALVSQPLTLSATSALAAQWEHVTFAPAGVDPINSTTFVFGNYRLGSIHGIKYDDLDGDGRLDASEPGIENIPIEVSWTDPVTGQIVSQLTTTMARGEYWFEDMPIGVQYTVRELPEDELVLTIPAGGFPDGFVLDVVGCDGPLTIEFDNNGVSQPGTVVVHFSSTDPEEQIAEATVAALLASGKFVGVEKVGRDEVHIDLGCRMASTDPIKEFMLMSGQEFVATKAQRDDLIDAGLSPERVIIRPDLAISNVTLGSIHGLKFEDRNANGQRDAGEPGLPGWTITLNGFTGLGQSVSLTTTTMSDNPSTLENESGQYWFTGLKPGTYTVGEVQQPNWALSTLLQSYVLRSGQELVAERGQAHLPDGSPKSELVREPLAIGNFRRGSVHGVKFDDANGNRRQDEKEALLAGWTIMLDGVDGMGNEVHLQTTTMPDDPRTKLNELGMYWFDNLVPGTYEITEVSQERWVRTVPASGSYTAELFSGELLDGYVFGNHKSFEFAPPILDVSLIPDFPSILSDVSDENNQGTSVAAFIGPFYPYPQVPLGFKAGLVVTGANNAQGMWQYSRDGGAMWTTFAGVTPMTAVLLGAEPGDRIRFVPQAGFHGTVEPGLTFGLAILSDIEVFSTSNPVDVSIRGAGTPFSAEIGTTNISVNAHEARFTLRVTDPAGQPIISVMVGGQFVLEGYVQDTRTSPSGVFAAYEDIFYDGSLVQIVGAIIIDPLFPNAPSGNTLTTGLLDEVGGTAGQDVTGGSPLLLFRQSFTATAAGTADFFNNPADASAHQVLLYFNASTTPTQNIDFVGASLTIERSGWQNPGNPLDVNNDGSVSPVDALIPINELNKFGSHALSSERPISEPFLDVNGDRFVSPLDVLLVFNHLNSRAGGEGEAAFVPFAATLAAGESAKTAGPLLLSATATSPSESLEATDAIFAALDDEQLESWSRRSRSHVRPRASVFVLPR